MQVKPMPPPGCPVCRGTGQVQFIDSTTAVYELADCPRCVTRYRIEHAFRSGYITGAEDGDGFDPSVMLDEQDLAWSAYREEHAAC